MPQHCFVAQQLNTTQFCRKMLVYGTFCREIYGTFGDIWYFSLQNVKINSFFPKTLKYALRGKILNEVRL